MGGCISTFTRPSENILTPKDKNVIVSAILDNLEHLPNPTLYKMSQMDFWKQQQQVYLCEINKVNMKNHGMHMFLIVSRFVEREKSRTGKESDCCDVGGPEKYNPVWSVGRSGGGMWQHIR